MARSYASRASSTQIVVLNDDRVEPLTTPLASPLQVAGILNSTFNRTNHATCSQASTTNTQSDSLILDLAGDLVLTGEADQEIVFVHNPGAANQTESFLNLLGTTGQTISGLPDDTVFPAAASGTFYVADTGANTVYALAANGLAPGSVYIDVGDEFGELDTSTGIVTPLFTGVSPHGWRLWRTRNRPRSFWPGERFCWPQGSFCRSAAAQAPDRGSESTFSD